MQILFLWNRNLCWTRSSSVFCYHMSYCVSNLWLFKFSYYSSSLFVDNQCCSSVFKMFVSSWTQRLCWHAWRFVTADLEFKTRKVHHCDKSHLCNCRFYPCYNPVQLLRLHSAVVHFARQPFIPPQSGINSHWCFMGRLFIRLWWRRSARQFYPHQISVQWKVWKQPDYMAWLLRCCKVKANVTFSFK